MMRDSWRALCVLLLVGCSAGRNDAAQDEVDATGGEADSGSEAADDGGTGGSTDTGPQILDAAWWKLSAQLEVVDGVVDPDASSLSLVSLDAELAERCTATADVALATAISPPEPEIVAWWQVVPGDWEGGCLEAELPVPVGTIQLGVGEMHPEIVAVADSVDEVEGDSSALNAAYARLSTGGDVYVFGVAGPTSAYAGEGEPATDTPLSDGTWWVTPAYAFTAESGW